jgi:hypothetical protein
MDGVAILLHTRKLLGSTLDSEMGHPKFLSWISSVSPRKCQNSTSKVVMTASFHMPYNPLDDVQLDYLQRGYIKHKYIY